MNESGRSVRTALDFYKLAPQDVTAFYDELDLAPMKVKVKQGGGAAGHNGIRSMIQHIGEDFRRVRIGIGHPGHKDRCHRPCPRQLSQKRDGTAGRPARRDRRRSKMARRTATMCGFQSDLALRLQGDRDPRRDSPGSRCSHARSGMLAASPDRGMIRKQISSALDHEASTVIVAEQGTRIVATAMTGLDGHRGWIYYLGVAPEHRGQRIARQLLDAACEWLGLHGCPKVELMLRDGNPATAAFTSILDGNSRTSAFSHGG